MSNFPKNNLKLSDFGYHLPENLIAQKPTKPRDHCRILILDKKTGQIQHKKFFEIEQFFRKGDVLVFNDSKVIPARLYGHKTTYHPLDDRPMGDNENKYDKDANSFSLGGKVEILLIKKISTDSWEAMLKNFKIKESGKEIIISLSSSHSSLSSSRMRGSRPEQNLDSRLRGNYNNSGFIATPIKNIGEGLWQIKFNLKNAMLDKAIHKYGQTPLPPYIKKMAKLADYQTIYAKKEGSVAAPTAGLHFTKPLINKLKKKGVVIEKITLHVGLGTFAPIREETGIEKHKMHSEYAEVSAKTAKAINKAKQEGRRVIAVGTTSARTLEAFAEQFKVQSSKLKVRPGASEVDIFIKPGYKFKIVDGMITNFHLPKTTLLLLVSALSSQENILEAYREAIKKKYKFFSFGDAMLII